MTPEDARAALDEIQQRRRQSRAEAARHGSSPFYVGVLALIVLLSYASFDLPNPWGGAMLFPVAALLALLAVVYLRRAPVRRRPDSGEVLVGAAAGIALAAVLRGLAAAAEALGAPAPHLVATVAALVVGLLVAGRVSRAAGSLARRRADRRP